MEHGVSALMGLQYKRQAATRYTDNRLSRCLYTLFEAMPSSWGIEYQSFVPLDYLSSSSMVFLRYSILSF